MASLAFAVRTSQPIYVMINSSNLAKWLCRSCMYLLLDIAIPISLIFQFFYNVTTEQDFHAVYIS